MAKKQRKKPKRLHPEMGCVHSLGLLPILIIILVWLPSITTTWSKVIITIAAALIILGKVTMHSSSYCNPKK